MTKDIKQTTDTTNITISRKDLSLWLLCFFRYSLGRHTYIVSDCCEDLVQYWEVMPRGYRQQIIDDIKQYLEDSLKYEHQCDIDSWKGLLKFAEENL